MANRITWIIFLTYPKHAGDTLYPPKGSGCPSVRSKPEETNTTSGSNSLAIGMMILLNAAKYSASPKGGFNPPDQAMFTLNLTKKSHFIKPYSK